MSERTPGGLFLVDDRLRDELLQVPACPPGVAPSSIPSFSTGRRVNVRLASGYSVTDARTWLVELDRPALLFTTAGIATHDSLIPLLEECARETRAIAIGSPAIGDDALAFLVANKLHGILCCAAFELAASSLDDLATFAGGSGAFAEPGGHALADLPCADRLVLSPTGLSIRPRE
jgi:hypothetical protein